MVVVHLEVLHLIEREEQEQKDRLIGSLKRMSLSKINNNFRVLHHLRTKLSSLIYKLK